MTIYLHKGKRVTRTYYLSLKHRKQKEQERFKIAIKYSKAGRSKAEACKELEMTSKGLDSLLYRKFGTVKWPIQ